MRLGLDIIDEPWAWQHWMTKNYSTVDDLLDGVEGNEPDTPDNEKEDTDEKDDENGDG